MKGGEMRISRIILDFIFLRKK
ncbi:competence-stimulating peptide ComC, partial [Streptococcus pneumoniae]